MIDPARSGAPSGDPAGRLTPAVRLAPAKLNLTLAILGRRADGLHDLHSVMVPLDLGDRLSVAPTTGKADTLRVDGLPAGPDSENLVLRAIAAIRAALASRRREDPPPALACRLEKRIPVAAGLAGGSSDAAAALQACLEIWGEELDAEALLRIAARLGSDVPFFLAGGAALVEGRGELIGPLAGIKPGPDGPPGVLLVTPSVAISTAEVYAAWDAGLRPRPGAGARAASEHLAGEMRDGLASHALLARAGVLASANDLWPAASGLVPELVPFRRSLTRWLKRPVGQSGSGPTCWVLYPSLEAAAQAADGLRTVVAAGELVAPGDRPPAIIASGIGGSLPLAKASRKETKTT